MTDADGGSDDDNGQVTTPAENPDGGNGGGSNTNPSPSNPEVPKTTYTITFDANGGTGDMNPQTAESGTEITLPESTFTKEGYIFAGWNTKDDGTGTNCEDKSKITLTGNITLYAKWAVTAANVSEAIKNIPADGKVHTVALVGEISEDTITAIRSALYENSGARISLDMSGTTGLTKIPEDAFYDSDECVACEALAGIVLPEGIESINESAFYECTNLTDIVIPDSVKTIGNNAFQSSGLASIKFGSGLESIGLFAFQACNSLTKITVPGNVKTIDEMTFDSCSNLEEVVLEEGVQTIGMHAFSSCRKLASVTIPKSVTSIGGYAFDGCDALQSVNYGGTVAEWTALKNDGKIDTNGNNDLLNAAINCTDGIVTTADKAASAIATLEGGTFKNPNIYTVKIISKEESDKDFLKEIGEKMNSRWNEYVKVNLDLSASGIEEIPENAFKGASLLGITLPNSLESIKTKAFYSTLSLKKIVIPDKVRIIEAQAFYDCRYLEEITLPASLTNMGEYAFSGCDKLETVKYGGSQNDWSKIELGEGAFTSGTKITCSDDNVITIE